MAKANLTAQRLRELLDYDPETGALVWRVRSGRSVVGTETKCLDASGRIQVRFGGRTYRASRLAWLHYYGCWPEHEIDHINGIKTDNRIANLRDVPRQINQQNIRSVPKHGKNRLLGASYLPKDRKWQSCISVNNKRISLGRFDTEEEAHAAYIAAKRRLHPGCTI